MPRNSLRDWPRGSYWLAGNTSGLCLAFGGAWGWCCEYAIGTAKNKARTIIPMRHISARLDRCAEDVRIHALVVPELEFVDVEMRYFLLTLWNVPMIPRFTMDQKPSMVLV